MVERVVYVGSVLHVFVNLANGERIQAWVPNDGEGATFAQGTPVSVHLPQDALRILLRIRAGRRSSTTTTRSSPADQPSPCRFAVSDELVTTSDADEIAHAGLAGSALTTGEHAIEHQAERDRQQGRDQHEGRGGVHGRGR